MSLGTVVIGGGSGFIGTNLVRMLKQKGYGTVVISRMPGPINISWTDLKKKGLPDCTTAVVNLAGQQVLNPSQRWNSGFKQNIYNSRINTTCALAQAINNASSPPKSFVTISGVGIYKPDQSKEYNEGSEVKPYDFLSEMCHDWEKAAVLSNVECNHARIRCGVVLGRNGGMIEQLYRPFYFGLGGPVMPGTQWLPWIHMTDLCKLIIFCIENEITGILNGVAPQIINNIEFSKAFAKAMNRPCIFPVPQIIVNLIFGRERAKMLTTGMKVKPDRTHSIGFKYDFSDILNACKDILVKPPDKGIF